MSSYSFHPIPRSRIATFDVFAMGRLKHHVAAMVEFDVTVAREKMNELKTSGVRVSFTAWLVRVIARVLSNHKEAAAFIYSKKKLMVFDDVNISVLVEKTIGGQKVPMPLVIEKAHEKSALEITAEIERAKGQTLAAGDVVLNKRSTLFENLYYHLPGFVRRAVWGRMLGNPAFAFSKMGNAVVTSVGMMGRIRGWFIHASVHPLSFGIGSIVKKPVVVDDRIVVREILNMTVLIDHDVIDGAPMVRFLNDLAEAVEGGEELPGSISKESP